MPSSLNIAGYPFLSPLDLILLSLSTKTILLTWIASSFIFIALIVVFGRFFCGWICPMGIILEYSHKFTEKDRRRVLGGFWTNYEKYAILLAVLAIALLFKFTIPYLFSPPGVIYRTILSIIVHGFIGADLFVLTLIFILDIIAIIFGRTWCNTLCPLGIVMSSLSVLNLFTPKVDQQKCIDFDFNCLHCEKVCPIKIPLTRANEQTMMECTKCLKCWANCPVDAIKIEF
jgi:ferredoxin-type protein NapH